MSHKLLEILIPSYLGERYLPHCLVALAQSSFLDFRVTVSIEGKFEHLDRVKAIAEHLGLTIDFLDVVKRMGLTENRRRLIRSCTSELVLWLDDDVLVSESALSTIMGAVPSLGAEYCVLTGVGSNCVGYPKVACALGFTLAHRDLWVSCATVGGDFGYATGEDWLWTSSIAKLTGKPIGHIPVILHHIGEHRRRKRYSREWDVERLVSVLGADFYETHQQELELSYPTYNYLDF